MSLIISAQKFQQAMDTIQELAETPSTASVVLSSTLEIIDRWSFLHKIFCRCCLNGYLRQLNPKKSVDRFRCLLSVALSTQPQDSAPGLLETCTKACDTFNRLIVVTNNESHPNKKIPEEKLHVDIEQEINKARVPQKIQKSRSEQLLTGRPGNRISHEDYDALFGDVARPSSKTPLPDSPASTSSDKSSPNTDSEFSGHSPTIFSPKHTSLKDQTVLPKADEPSSKIVPPPQKPLAIHGRRAEKTSPVEDKPPTVIFKDSMHQGDFSLDSLAEMKENTGSLHSRRTEAKKHQSTPSGEFSMSLRSHDKLIKK